MLKLLKCGIVKFVILILTISLATAQISGAVNIRKKSLYKSNHREWPLNRSSVGLTFNNNLVNDELGGVSISGTNYYSPTGAVRFNIDLGHSLRSYYDDENIFYYDGRYLDDIDSDELNEIRLSVQNLFSTSSMGHVNFLNFYWALGPIVTLHQTDIRNSEIYLNDYYGWIEYETENKYRSIGVGGVATLGLEMFVAPNFSILGEYEFSLQHEWAEVVYDEVIDPDRNIIGTFSYHDQFNFTTSQVKLGVAYHF